MNDMTIEEKCKLLANFVNFYGKGLPGEDVSRISVRHSSPNPINNSIHSSVIGESAKNNLALYAIEEGYIEDDICLDIAKEHILEQCRMDKEMTWNQMSLMIAVVNG